ncbi:hypothetical protein TrLO_g6823 [Triparma laevis f. longispina]|nr:hypothetical protein TrLO_g6823 [Triparma laevis f. longispina]
MIPEKGSKEEEEEVTVEREEKKEKNFRDGEEKQIGRHKSFIGGLANRKKNYKVAPEGVKKEQIIDVQEFKREMAQ